MTVYENTVFGKKGVKEADEELAERLYLRVSDHLSKSGYEHYEVSSFARKGKRSRHNMLYWTGGEYEAFGSGACGYENGVRYRYPSGAESFAKAMGRIEKIIEATDTVDSKMSDALIFGLRTADGIPLSSLKNGAVGYADLLCKNGLAAEKEGRFRLTPRGWLVSNEIITELLENL